MPYNILVTSDVHIGDYKTYNPVTGFRLNQFLKLSEFITEKVRENDVKEIWIAGDLLVTAKSSPKVMYVVKKFLTRLANSVDAVRLILGNHDVLIRNDSTDITEYKKSTLVTLLDGIPKLKIYVSEVVKIQGKLVHFQSWMPSNNFQYESADYLVAHGDSIKDLSPFSNQDSLIDYSKYSRAFVGHIHVPYEKESLVSPGTPIPHNFGDRQDTSLVLFDLLENTVSRIPTYNNFLSFQYVKDESEALKLESEYKSRNQDVLIKVRSTPKTESVELGEVNLDDLDINPKGVLSQFTKDLSDDAKKVIDEVVSESHELETETPDLRVTFSRLIADNFKSIAHIDFDFTKYNGLTAIVGNNGSGKSTLFNLVLFMLLGKLPGYNKSDYENLNTGGEFHGELTLRYRNYNYRIERGLSWLNFYKSKTQDPNDFNYSPINSNKKLELQKTLESELSFIRFIDLIYIRQGSTGIFSDMSSTSRVSFLSNFMGLDLIINWTNLLNKKVSEINKDYVESTNKVNTYKTRVSDIEDYISDNKDHTEPLDDSQVQNLLIDVGGRITKLQGDINSVVANRSDILNKMKGIDELKVARGNLLVRIQKAIVSIDNDVTAIKDVESELSTKTLVEIDPNNIKLYEDTINDYSDILSTLQVSYKSEYKVLESLNAHPDVCPTCNQKWIIPDLDKKKDEAKQKLDKLKDKITVITSNINKSKESLTKLRSDIESNNSYKNLLDKKSNLESTLEKDKEYRNELMNELSKYGVYRIQDNEFELVEDKIPKQTELEAEVAELDKVLGDLNTKLHELNSERDKYNQTLGSITIHNEIYKKIQSNKLLIEELNKGISDLNDKLKSESDLIDELTRFNSKILSDKGMLVATLLSKIATHLNTDKNLKIETIETLNNGSLRPTLNIKLYVKEYDKYIDYDFLSGGQRLQADLRFLNGLTSVLKSVSVIFMDELFKFFDEDSIIESAEIIKEMNIKQVFLILHGGLHSAITNSVIQVKLDGEKGSLYG